MMKLSIMVVASVIKRPVQCVKTSSPGVAHHTKQCNPNNDTCLMGDPRIGAGVIGKSCSLGYRYLQVFDKPM